MKQFIVLVLLVLIACTTQDKEILKAPSEQIVKEIAPSSLPIEKIKLLPTRTVQRESSKGPMAFGLTEQNTLLHIDKGKDIWDFKYEGGRLVSVIGADEIEFLYENNQLAAIDLGAIKYFLRYDSKGRLVEVKGPQESWHIDYDTLDQVRAVKRGVSGGTSFYYDPKGKIKMFSRGQKDILVEYDDRNRVRNMDADDTKFILGYWRDDKVISLTGATFGRGLAVSYGPDYPPFEAKIIYENDDSTFTAAYTDTLYKIVDEYVYCNEIRRLKELLFEGNSYVFFTNYFKRGLPEYIAMQFICKAYETET